MPTCASSRPTRPAKDPEATPGRSCAAAWKPTTPTAHHPPTRPTTPATPAPPTPPATAPSNAGTPNSAGSAALRDAEPRIRDLTRSAVRAAAASPRRRGGGRCGRRRRRRGTVPVLGGACRRHRHGFRGAAARRLDLARALEVVAALDEARLALEEHRQQGRRDEDRRVGAGHDADDEGEGEVLQRARPEDEQEYDRDQRHQGGVQ